MERELIIGGYYKHFKGNVYHVIAEALDASNSNETEKFVVVYQRYNIKTKSFETYVRDKNEFLSKVDKEKYPNETQEYRFELVEKRMPDYYAYNVMG